MKQMKWWSVQRKASRSSALELDVTAMAAEMEQPVNGTMAEALCPDLVRASGRAVAVEDDLGFACSDRGDADPFVGKRVQIHSLQSMGELNGREGVVLAFDSSKGRYRVRLDSELDDDVERPRVVAFKASNLHACG